MPQFLPLDLINGPFIPVMYRMEWGARSPTGSVQMKLPVSYVRLSYVRVPLITSRKEGIQALRDIQKNDMDSMHRELYDVAANFYIDPLGLVYEGRGWKSAPFISPEPQFAYLERKCLHISYLMDLDPPEPKLPWTMERTMVELVQYAIKNKFLKPYFKIVNYSTKDRFDDLHNPGYSDPEVDDPEAYKPRVDNSLYFSNPEEKGTVMSTWESEVGTPVDVSGTTAEDNEINALKGQHQFDVSDSVDQHPVANTIMDN